MSQVKAKSGSDIVSTAEAAKLLDVRRGYVTVLVKAGKLPATRLSSRVIVLRVDDVMRYLRESRQMGMGGPRRDGTDFRAEHGEKKRGKKK